MPWGALPCLTKLCKLFHDRYLRHSADGLKSIVESGWFDIRLVRQVGCTALETMEILASGKLNFMNRGHTEKAMGASHVSTTNYATQASTCSGRKG